MTTPPNGAYTGLEATHLSEKLEARPTRFTGPGAMAVRFGRVMVQRYLKILLALESELESKERELVRSPDDAILSQLILCKSDLTRMRRIFDYHTELLNVLKGNLLPGFNPAPEHELNDLYEQQQRATSLAGLDYQLAPDLIDG